MPPAVIASATARGPRTPRWPATWLPRCAPRPVATAAGRNARPVSRHRSDREHHEHPATDGAPGDPLDAQQRSREAPFIEGEANESGEPAEAGAERLQRGPPDGVGLRGGEPERAEG